MNQNKRYRCPDCTARRGLAIYKDGAGYCFACEDDEKFKDREYLKDMELEEAPAEERDLDFKHLFKSATFSSFPARGITNATAEFFGVRQIDGMTLFPYRDAHKLKFPEKDFLLLNKEEFHKPGLFGQERFTKGGKYLLITEGEEDAMAAFQMQGSTYPVVSVKCGADAALEDCKASYEWIDSFETVVICFDNDDAGKRAAEQVAALFPEKSRIYKHAEGYSDACDYSAKKQDKKFQQLFWRAEQHVPDEIVLSSELYDDVMKPLDLPFCNYPWDCLNLMLYGQREGEIVTLMAGSGVGKSTVVKEIIKHIKDNTTCKIGVLTLEESIGVAGMAMMSLHSNHRFHLPTKEMMGLILNDPTRVAEKPFLDDVTEEERMAQKKEAFEAILSDDRFAFLDHKGNITIDNVISRMKYLAKSQDCKVILLDHVSILVGLVAKKTNEREAIDEVMHHLRKLVEETGVMLLNICHLRKPSEGKGHEEGRRVQAIEARGSGAIVQLSNIALALEGNRQAEDPAERNLTTLRVLKNRFSGETGEAGVLRYDEETGRLVELDKFVDEEAL